MESISPHSRHTDRSSAWLAACLLGAVFASAMPSHAQFAGIRRYGSPTLGCAGASSIGVSGAPIVGDSTFRITCQGALPLAGGLLALSGGEQSPPIVYLSAYIWLRLPAPFNLPVTMTNLGIASVPLPIPRVPALIGGNLFAQFLWADTGPSCAGSVLAGTDALQITIQSPPDAGEPNDNAAQATPISSGTPLSRILCPAGDEDWFRFTTTGNSSVQVLMTPPAARNYDLQLRNGSAAIATSANASSASESISACVAAGTYYLRVYGAAQAFDPFATYSLALSVATSSGSAVYTSTAPVTLANNWYHPTFSLFGVASSTGCDERITITITGSYTRACAAGSLQINANAQGQFPFTVATTSLPAAAGTFTISGSFLAARSVVYDFGLMGTGMATGCSVSIPAGATMTVTRS